MGHGRFSGGQARRLYPTGALCTMRWEERSPRRRSPIARSISAPMAANEAPPRTAPLVDPEHLTQFTIAWLDGTKMNSYGDRGNLLTTHIVLLGLRPALAVPDAVHAFRRQ